MQKSSYTAYFISKNTVDFFGIVSRFGNRSFGPVSHFNFPNSKQI